MGKLISTYRVCSAAVDMRSVTIRHAGLNAGMRSAKFDHRDHLVVPVIALVEGVLHAVNAQYPELVLASEFSIAPGGWGGRPVTWDHPQTEGSRITANTPRTLERYQVGQVFNPVVEDKKLILESWLDSRREVLPEAKDLHQRIRLGEAVEVSVGVFVVAEEKEGTYNGKPYKAIWREIVPDHLAMLPKGAIGACSIADGCGAPRTATTYFLTAAGGYEPVQEITLNKCDKCQKEHDGPCAQEDAIAPRSLRERVLALLNLGKKKPDDLTSKSLQETLETTLRAEVPGFLGVDDINLTANEVLYAAAPDPDVVQLYLRSYKVGEDNSVTLASKGTEVVPVVHYEPVAASTAEPKHACSCQDKHDANHEGETMKIATDRVKALIAKSKGAFTEADLAFLEGKTEDQFKVIEGGFQEPTVVTTPPVTTPVVAPVTPEAPKQLTEEEWLKTAPDSIRAIVEKSKADEQATRAASINRLKTAQTAFTEQDLTAMSTDQLRKLDLAIPRPRAAVDYSIRDAAHSNPNDPNVVPAAPDLGDRIRAARTKAS